MNLTAAGTGNGVALQATQLFAAEDALAADGVAAFRDVGDQLSDLLSRRGSPDGIHFRGAGERLCQGG